MRSTNHFSYDRDYNIHLFRTIDMVQSRLIENEEEKIDLDVDNLSLKKYLDNYDIMTNI